MKDMIYRQAAIDALKGLEFCHYMEFGEYIGEDTREVRLIRAEKAQDALQNLLSAQPERKTGKWINGVCDQCGSHAPYWAMASTYYRSSFCPNCGADMRGTWNETN